ncbi:hypothetical protein KQY30_20220 [Streptomyces sp. GMY02]|uniref:DUF6415 family natural product biosynthesis protein n=1 Tax=Streptomyces sp. GMY02 TaxID=1333528 RepID=UPI001C2BB523|nr:DUF6415 family natural product biosynthesis protein [Streptomyces sp. GMY02]QXE36223.1 hypothetical protein KQY30_20220 [Streptomyces sp. GMY02]
MSESGTDTAEDIRAMTTLQTARPAAPDTDSLPLDFATMRATAQHTVDFGIRLLPEDLDTAILRLRAHLALLIPEAEQRLGRFSPAGIEEARRRVAADPGLLGPVWYAHSLARSVLTLCAHLGHGEEPSDG